jgi:BirA family biotin operon repressor/biotin-[acetyl-CoA-carboxylase] ligase
MMIDPSISWSQTQAVSQSFRYLDSVESTNTWLMAQNTVNASEVVVTLNQVGGRGRWGRQWVNRPGEGLALSVAVPPMLEANARKLASTWIPLLMGVAVVQSVRSIGIQDASMKWPNDVLVGGRKLAGILCEVRPDGHVVAGVGINVRFSDDPPDSRAISLDEVLKDAPSMLDKLVAGIIHRLSQLVDGDSSQQREAVTSVLGTIGRDVQVLGRDGSTRTGRAVGLDEHGALLVRMTDGSTRVVTSSDIEHLYQ